MNNAALDLASVMLEITRAKFCNNFHDIKKVKIFWHNLTLLYFATAICKQLSASSHMNAVIYPPAFLNCSSAGFNLNTPLFFAKAEKIVKQATCPKGCVSFSQSNSPNWP